MNDHDNNTPTNETTNGTTTNAPALDLNTLPVTIEYVGEVKARTKDEWAHDLWRVTITKAGDRHSYHSFDYKTGLGLRKSPFPRIAKANPYVAMAQAKPVKPTIAGVLHCLLMDAEAGNSNFHDWCSDYGYSDDSIKALNTYKLCLDTATALRKYFTRAELDEIRRQTEDL